MKKKIFIEDMSCKHCEITITNALDKMNNVKVEKIDFSKGYVIVDFYDQKVKEEDIIKEITKLDYTVTEKNPRLKSNLISIGIISLLFVGYLIINNTLGLNVVTDLDTNVSYWFLFVAGLLTSFHCICMCGGISLSQTLKEDRKSIVKSNLKYNLGRIISYTTIGGIVGGIGQVITISNSFKSWFPIVIGVFMVLLGLRYIGLISFKIPFINVKIFNNKKLDSFVVGLINGFMPCGPLQTMQLYAMGTGSFTKGALSMFAFSTGTVFLMVLFGFINLLFKNTLGKNMLKVSGIIILLLGMIMINRGLSLQGYAIDLSSLIPEKQETTEVIISETNSSETKNTNQQTNKETQNFNQYQEPKYKMAEIKDGKQIINMTVSNNGYKADNVRLKKGIPVILKIQVESINGCNNPIVIPKYNIEVDMNESEEIVEFTPEEAGKIQISCWMGMITETIRVMD